MWRSVQRILPHTTTYAQAIARTRAAPLPSPFRLPLLHTRAYSAQGSVVRSEVSASMSTDKTAAEGAPGALAVPESAVASSSSSSADDSGASFEHAVPAAAAAAPRAQPVVYRPFVPTSEWQVIADDHILPPGLAIKMDMDSGVKMARLAAAPSTPAPAAATSAAKLAGSSAASTTPTTPTPASAPAGAPVVKTPIAQAALAAALAKAGGSSSAAAAGVSSSSTSPPSPAASSASGAKKQSAGGNGTGASARTPSPAVGGAGPAVPGNGAGKGSATAPKAKKPCNSRGMSTAAGADGTPRPPIVYPVFPTPSAEFLAARAPLPAVHGGPGPKGPVISVAPMVDVTDRHYRFMMRLITRHAVLYTPMIVDHALIRAPHAHALYTDHQALEHPLVAQLGGSEKESMVDAAKRCEQQGFQAININVGCPAPSAIGHSYGACLMCDPSFPSVVRAMVDSVSIPVSIKCRIGVNKDDSYEFFSNFIDQCHTVGGVNHFIVHARKALLNLKSAGKNLTIPTLNYDFVYRLKRERPELRIEINGGVESLDAAAEHIEKGGVDGVMFGRLAWKQPYALSGVDQRFYGSKEEPMPRKEVAEKYLEYVERVWEENVNEIKEWERKHGPTAAAAAAAAAGTNGAVAAEAIAHDTDPLVVAARRADASLASAASLASTVPGGAPSSSSSPAPPGLRHGSSYLATVCPAPLDPRTLLRPMSYLYTHEPGYRRFRLLFEEGLLRHKDWSMRHIIERAMAAVEPPPPRDWGNKDSGYEFTEQAKAEMAEARAALAQGGPSAAARHQKSKGDGKPAAAASASAAASPDDVSAQMALASLDGEAQCSAATASSPAADSGTSRLACATSF